MKDNDFVSISIPKKLFNKISQEIRNTSPQAVSKYVTYILEKKLSSEEKKKFTAKKIRKRLKKDSTS